MSTSSVSSLAPNLNNVLIPEAVKKASSKDVPTVVSPQNEVQSKKTPPPPQQTQSFPLLPVLLGSVLAVGGLGFIFRKPLLSLLERFQKKAPPLIESLGDNTTPPPARESNTPSIIPPTTASTSRSSGGSSGRTRSTTPPAKNSGAPNPSNRKKLPWKWGGIVATVLVTLTSLTGWTASSLDKTLTRQSSPTHLPEKMEQVIEETPHKLNNPFNATKPQKAPEIKPPSSTKSESTPRVFVTQEKALSSQGKTLFPADLPKGITPYHLAIQDGNISVMQGNKVLYTRPFSSDVDTTEYLKNPHFSYEKGFEDGSSRVVLVIEDKNLQSVITIVHDHSKSWWDKLISADLFSSPVRVVERSITYTKEGYPRYGPEEYLSGTPPQVDKSAAESELQKLLPDIKEAEDNVKAWETHLEEAKKASPPNAKHIEDLKNNHVAYWKDRLANLEVQRQKLKAQIEAEKK